VISDRYYLADAEFLVGLEGLDEALLQRCHAALGAPHWPISLGRKSFTPGLPVQLPDGLVDAPLPDSLTQYPWRPRGREQGPKGPLRLVIETDDPTCESRLDKPLSFRNGARRFAVRYIETRLIQPAEVSVGGDLPCSCPG
jgi:CRISPR system Cascade subunit CasD